MMIPVVMINIKTRERHEAVLIGITTPANNPGEIRTAQVTKKYFETYVFTNDDGVLKYFDEYTLDLLPDKIDLGKPKTGSS